ncbi:MAG: TolC family protein [Pseudomonadota bacterium]
MITATPIRLLTLALLLVSALPGAAATLDADEFVAAVLIAHPDVDAATAAVDAAAARQRFAAELDDPQLSYSLAPATLGDAVGTRQIAQLSQTLPWPGTLATKAALAERQTAAARAGRDTTLAALTESARQGWLDWWYVHAALELNAEALAALRPLLPATTGQYAAGGGSQLELLRAEAALDALAVERVRLEQQRRRVRAGLNALRDAPAQARVEPPGPLPAHAPGTAAAALDVEDDPRLRTISDAVAAAAVEVELAELSGKPNFRASLGYVGTLDPADKRLQAGISLNIPLNRARRRAEVGAARADLRRLEAQRRELRRRLDATADIERSGLQEAEQLIALYVESLLPRAREAARAADLDYRAGRADFATLVAAEQQRIRTERELAGAQADRWRAAARLERLRPGAFWPIGATTEGR